MTWTRSTAASSAYGASTDSPRAAGTATAAAAAGPSTTSPLASAAIATDELARVPPKDRRPEDLQLSRGGDATRQEAR
jgi:hypothetical protein